jgi:uncharacterized protein (TIGR02466 family)
MNEHEIIKLFPEPIFRFKLENFEVLNNDLAKYIYNLRDGDKIGITKSNRGGWHSQYFSLDQKESIQQKFALLVQQYIIKVFQLYGWKIKDVNIRIQHMWAIINKKNDFNVVHTHPNCFLSAAYYVKASKNCGRFTIESPNIAKRHSYPVVEHSNELNVEVASLDVNEGDLLIFPSYLPHKVGINKSDDDRIVISFNVDIKD